jgi:endonuclease-3
MKNMRKHEKLKNILEILKQAYPEPKCMLNYSKPYELLIAARLSAQCTDKRVNMVTPELFKKFPDVIKFANSDVTEIENIIKPCGLFRTKASNIKGMCQILQEEPIPDDLETLLKLPGVGRKTANLILGELYGKPAIVVDTHVIRLSNRLGLAMGKNAFKIEQILRKQIPKHESMAFCHRLVLHGRQVCKARNPHCSNCALQNFCVSFT